MADFLTQHFKTLLGDYQVRFKTYNRVFFWLLVVLNILDVALTWWGVIKLQAFGEGNCYFKDSIENGEVFPMISFKVTALLILGFFFWKLNTHHYKNTKIELINHKIATFGLVFLNSLYLYTILHWIVLLTFYHIN